MARYASEEYEDLDEYEEDGEEGQEEYEDEYEQDEACEPSPGALEYLELRQRLKERFRKKMKKEMGTATSSRNIRSSLSKDNFGSFFGPSQPVIAKRVIEESKSLLENPELAAKLLKASNANGKVHDSNSVRPKASSSSSSNAPKVSYVPKTKIQEVKNARDYSFLLSDDAQIPAAPKPPLPKKVSAPSPDSRSAQSLPRDTTGRKLPNGHEVRRPLPGSSQLKPRPAIQKPVSVSKQNLLAREPKKEPIRSNGSSHAPKNLPSKSSAGMTERRASTSDMKRPLPNVPRSNPLPNVPRSNPLKPQPTISRQPMVHKKTSQDSSKPKMIQKPSASSSRPPPVTMQRHALPSTKPQVVMQKRVLPSSKPQIKQPAIKNPERRPAKRPMRSDEEDGDDIRLQIRQMFGYNPNRYQDDDDDSDMEANFADIQEEEFQSAKIARMEDEEELRKLEEEERRARLRKEKKRKLR